MRTHHPVIAPLAALLAAAALAGPAAAIPPDVSHTHPKAWYAGASTIPGSTHSPSRQTPEITAPGATTSQPIARPAVTASAASRGFDWASAGIGAAGGVGTFAVALACAASTRRRRDAPRRSVASH
jgi:non-ribosomal peptide synthetase component F